MSFFVPLLLPAASERLGCHYAEWQDMFKMEDVVDYCHVLGIYSILMVFISGFEHNTFIPTAVTELLSGKWKVLIQCWICQFLSQSGCRIKCPRKLLCSRISNAYPSVIVQIVPLYYLVTGATKLWEEPPPFICNNSFRHNIFILMAVLLTSPYHLSLPALHSAAQHMPSSVHSTHASFQSFTTLSLFSTLSRRALAAPSLHLLVPHASFSLFLECFLHHTFLPLLCLPYSFSRFPPWVGCCYPTESRSFGKAAMLLLQNSNRKNVKDQKSMQKCTLEDWWVEDGANVKCLLKHKINENLS